MDPIRILVVDDHPIVRDGLELLVSQEPGFRFLGHADTVQKGLARLAGLPADIVVLDLGLPGTGGLDAIGLFLVVRPEARVVIYSGNDSAETVRRAVASGARGYVVKGESIAELLAVLRQVHAGELGFSRRISAAVIDASLKAQPVTLPAPERFGLLSPRERQVFELLARGLTTREVEDVLAISPKTVAKHRVNLLRKLRLRNAVELVLYARKHGLAGPEPPSR